MKNTIFIALILLAGILTSCGSVKYFGIETFTPAEITFPETVETVVIVNNAVPQPKKPGYKYTIMGVEQEKTLTDLKEVVEEYKLNCNPFKYRIIINSLVDE